MAAHLFGQIVVDESRIKLAEVMETAGHVVQASTSPFTVLRIGERRLWTFADREAMDVGEECVIVL